MQSRSTGHETKFLGWACYIAILNFGFNLDCDSIFDWALSPPLFSNNAMYQSSYFSSFACIRILMVFISDIDYDLGTEHSNKRPLQIEFGLDQKDFMDEISLGLSQYIKLNFSSSRMHSAGFFPDI